LSIVILDETTASKIAAGEVIERPASVVKELIENALDAGARQVEVEIRAGGRELIRVTDSGQGMSPEDAVLSLQRHATSKIRSADDLFAVTTLGFRGEALPSIASVSHMALVTRTRDAGVATRLLVVGGEVTEMEETGAPFGTQVTVSRIFYNTPARLKFLKRDEVEEGHIADVFTRFLFSHPDRAFRLIMNGREAMQYAGSDDLRAAALAAWGRQVAEAMVPVALNIPTMSVRGLTSAPEVHRATRSRELSYINHRCIRNRAITHALEEAYREVLPQGRYPTAALLIEVDPSVVDVNVHPAKAEVRLSREPDVHHLVSQAVRQALAGFGSAGRAQISFPGPRPASAAPAPQSQAPSELPGGWAGTLTAPGVLSPAFQRATAAEGIELRPLAQLRQTYILAESRQGLLLVDQHRAQERVLYERFAAAKLGGSSGSQALLSPAVVQLSAREATVLAEHLEELGRMGLSLEPFGSDAFLVRAVPVELIKEDPVALVRDIADSLTADDAGRSVERRQERLLVTLSCRSSVKAGEALSYEEMVELLKALSATARPYTCPHGWPIIMTISNFEIDRKFNR
jgi:DNA mismatch repair protein MutL